MRHLFHFYAKNVSCKMGNTEETIDVSGNAFVLARIIIRQENNADYSNIPGSTVQKRLQEEALKRSAEQAAVSAAAAPPLKKRKTEAFDNADINQEALSLAMWLSVSVKPASQLVRL